MAFMYLNETNDLTHPLVFYYTEITSPSQYSSKSLNNLIQHTSSFKREYCFILITDTQRMRTTATACTRINVFALHCSEQ